VESDEGTRQFPEDLVPPRGVFWLAWTSLLRGKIVVLEGQADPALVARWTEGLDSLASAYLHSENPYQPSYEGMAWSGDNVMAMLAMATHDRQTRTERYQPVIRRWVAMVRTSLDPATGMPPFELDHPGGVVVKTPRGSSQTLFAWALTEIDTAFAREQYIRLRETFYTTRLGLPMVREFPVDSQALADYDSGPVIWGVGSSATIVTLATARRFGDTTFARSLESAIRFFGLPMRWRGRTAFALGQGLDSFGRRASSPMAPQEDGGLADPRAVPSGDHPGLDAVARTPQQLPFRPHRVSPLGPGFLRERGRRLTGSMFREVPAPAVALLLVGWRIMPRRSEDGSRARDASRQARDPAGTAEEARSAARPRRSPQSKTRGGEAPRHDELRSMIAQSRTRLAAMVNSELTRLYWSVGERLRREVLGGERAAYEARIVARQGETLAAEFGRGFEARNPRRMIQFVERGSLILRLCRHCRPN